MPGRHTRKNSVIKQSLRKTPSILLQRNYKIGDLWLGDLLWKIWLTRSIRSITKYKFGSFCQKWPQNKKMKKTFVLKWQSCSLKKGEDLWLVTFYGRSDWRERSDLKQNTTYTRRNNEDSSFVDLLVTLWVASWRPVHNNAFSWYLVWSKIIDRSAVNDHSNKCPILMSDKICVSFRDSGWIVTGHNLFKIQQCAVTVAASPQKCVSIISCLVKLLFTFLIHNVQIKLQIRSSYGLCLISGLWFNFHRTIYSQNVQSRWRT